MALLLVLEMPLESCTLLSTKYNLCYLQHVLGTDYSHSAEGEKNNPGEQEAIKKKKERKFSKAVEGQHGVLNKDSNKELEVQHVCAQMHRKSYFAFDQLHRA